MKKKFLALAMAALTLAGCGHSSMGNEALGQVKKVVYETPIVCGNYVQMDVSLGVVRNGVGSMSNQDKRFNLNTRADIAVALEAVETGALVKVTYDEARFHLCIRGLSDVTHIELLK